MKKLILIIGSLLLLCLACTDNKKKSNAEDLVDTKEIQQMEKENKELQTLEEGIESDMKEMDALLDDIDKL